MNLSFAGCGFLGIYHVGVAGCFKQYAPHLVMDKISGASAGAITACCLICDLPLGELTTNILRVAQEARKKALGPFSPSFKITKILRDGLEKALPEDAHLKTSGKLHISMTRVYDGRNIVVSDFRSKEDLIQALLASSFIPFFSGMLPPKFRGARCMDGGFSDNLPMLNENTISVSPFCGESDICPRDVSSQLYHINYSNTSIELSKHNIYRFGRIMFPPKPEVLSNMCKQGFDDALRFLQRNNLLNCTRCLAVQSTFIVTETLDESPDYDPDCKECKRHRKEALVADLPETISSIFQEAIETANQGIVNWIFKHKGMKLLSVLTLPCTLPVDIVYATFTNIIGNHVDTNSYELCMLENSRFEEILNCGCREHLHFNDLKTKYTRFVAASPKLGSNLMDLSQYLINQLTYYVDQVNKKRQQISGNISCQLAISSVYTNSKYDINRSGDISTSVKNKMHFNFSLNVKENVREAPAVDYGSNRQHPRKVLSRRSSEQIAAPPDSPVDDDTFEHILQVTAHHDAVMAYYYMDENNKVKVTEIFDVTDAENNIVMTPEEQDNNKQLQFEDEWGDSGDQSDWLSQQTLVQHGGDYDDDESIDLSDISLDDELCCDSRLIFSDPESEWNAQNFDEDNVQTLDEQDLVGHESDRESNHSSNGTTSLSRKSSYAAMET